MPKSIMEAKNLKIRSQEKTVHIRWFGFINNKIKNGDSGVRYLKINGSSHWEENIRITTLMQVIQRKHCSLFLMQVGEKLITATRDQSQQMPCGSSLYIA